MSAQTGSTTFASDPGLQVARYDAPEAVQPQYSELSSSKEPSKEAQTVSSRYSGSKSQSRISRIGLGTWSVLLVALTAIVVGGAVGGGLGAKLANCQTRPPRLQNVTVTNNTVCPMADLSNYTAAPPDTVSLLYTGCPHITSQRYTTRFDETYAITCGVDSGFGAPTTEDTQKTLQVKAALIAYSLDDCIEACSAYTSFNARNGDSQLKCRSVSWDRRMERALSRDNHVNCWLKNGTLATSQLTRQDDGVVAMID